MIVVGDKEEVSNTVSVRRRGEGDIGQMNVDDFIKKVKEEIDDKKLG